MINLKPITDQTRWENFVASYPEANFLQSWSWGEVLALEGHSVHRLGIYSGNKLVGVCQSAQIRAKRGSQLVIPGGPLIDWDKPTIWPSLLDHLTSLARDHKLDYLKLRTQLRDTPTNREIFHQSGFRLSSQHFTADHSWVLDLVGMSKEELLAGMRKNTRYAIRKGEKLKLKIQKSCTNQDLEQLIKLDQLTSQRQGFVSYPASYYRHIHESLAPTSNLSYYKIYHPDGQLLIINLIIHYHGESVYYISGSTSDARNLPVAPTLLWHIIKDRRKIDTRFNFWGVAPDDSKNHRYQGVTTFKRGFGGRAIDYTPAMELPLTWRYWPTHLYESIMKAIKNL